MMMHAVFLIVGIVLLWLALNKNKKLKNVMGKIEKTESIRARDDKTFKTRQMLEKTDVFLRSVSKFDGSPTWKILSAFGTFMIAYGLNAVFSLGMSSSTLGLIGVFGILTAFFLPSWLQKAVIASRVQKINKDIPMFVDLLGICVQSGMNVEKAIAFLDENTAQINKGFAPFLRQLVLKSQISGLESAIDDLQNDLPSTQVAMMCITLKQSLKYGSSIYETLMNLSMEIREFELLKTEETIGKLSAKMSIPLILFFMFPVIIIIAAPGVMKVLEGF